MQPWFLSLMKILLSLIRSHHFLSPAILIFVSFTVSIITLILKQPVPSLLLLSTLNLTTVTLYYSLPKSQLNCLQEIQNCLARTVVKAPKSSHITPILRSLHWLKISEQIEYKLVTHLQCSYIQGRSSASCITFRRLTACEM